MGWQSPALKRSDNDEGRCLLAAPGDKEHGQATQEAAGLMTDTGLRRSDKFASPNLPSDDSWRDTGKALSIDEHKEVEEEGEAEETARCCECQDVAMPDWSCAQCHC